MQQPYQRSSRLYLIHPCAALLTVAYWRHHVMGNAVSSRQTGTAQHYQKICIQYLHQKQINLLALFQHCHFTSQFDFLNSRSAYFRPDTLFFYHLGPTDWNRSTPTYK